MPCPEGVRYSISWPTNNAWRAGAFISTEAGTELDIQHAYSCCSGLNRFALVKQLMAAVIPSAIIRSATAVIIGRVTFVTVVVALLGRNRADGLDRDLKSFICLEPAAASWYGGRTAPDVIRFRSGQDSLTQLNDKQEILLTMTPIVLAM